MTHSEKGNIRRLIDLFKCMNRIISSNPYNDICYGKQTIDKIVGYLSEEINNNLVDYEGLIEDISVRYRSMFPPRGGLSDFHIWDENYEIRHNANCEYAQVKKQIEDILDNGAIYLS